MKNVQEMKGLCEAYAFSQKSEPIICVCRKFVVPLHRIIAELNDNKGFHTILQRQQSPCCLG